MKYWFVGKEKKFLFGIYFDILFVEVCIKCDEVRKILVNDKDFGEVKKVELFV